VPVVLVGDIDRGGVIAALVGTRAVLDPADAAMIRGFVINKFRGDPRCLPMAIADRGAFGLARLWPGAVAGGERAPAQRRCRGAGTPCPGAGALRVACPILPRIANFDDLDPLKAEPGVELVMVPPGQPIPGDCALIVLPGSKATLADIAALRAQGWDIDISPTIAVAGASWAFAAATRCWARRCRSPWDRGASRAKCRAGPARRGHRAHRNAPRQVAGRRWARRLPGSRCTAAYRRPRLRAALCSARW
jgi:hypothetical protein